MDPTLRRRTVLCVQTCEDASEWFPRALSAYNCVFVSNAYEAICCLHSRVLDGYVLDYWLTDWAGPSLCREIRRYDPNSPVLFFAEASGENERKRALRAGANDYVCKPTAGDVLSATLERLFSEADVRSLHAETEAEEAARAVLERSVAAETPSTPLKTSPHVIEQIARTRAYKAFIASGGTRAHFDHRWPHIFDGVRAGIVAG